LDGRHLRQLAQLSRHGEGLDACQVRPGEQRVDGFAGPPPVRDDDTVRSVAPQDDHLDREGADVDAGVMHAVARAESVAGGEARDARPSEPVEDGGSSLAGC
jgi:hypothetical protein